MLERLDNIKSFFSCFWKSHTGPNLSKYQGQEVSIFRGKRRSDRNWPFVTEYLSADLSLTNLVSETAVLCNKRRNAIITPPLLEISCNHYDLRVGLVLPACLAAAWFLAGNCGHKILWVGNSSCTFFLSNSGTLHASTLAILQAWRGANLWHEKLHLFGFLSPPYWGALGPWEEAEAEPILPSCPAALKGMLNHGLQTKEPCVLSLVKLHNFFFKSKSPGLVIGFMLTHSLSGASDFLVLEDKCENETICTILKKISLYMCICIYIGRLKMLSEERPNNIFTFLKYFLLYLYWIKE